MPSGSVTYARKTFGSSSFESHGKRLSLFYHSFTDDDSLSATAFVMSPTATTALTTSSFAVAIPNLDVDRSALMNPSRWMTLSHSTKTL